MAVRCDAWASECAACDAAASSLPSPGTAFAASRFTEGKILAGDLPGAFAPRTFCALLGSTPAARRRRTEVAGVRRMKWKDRSGRMVMRDGMGVPVFIWAVSALNSCCELTV